MHRFTVGLLASSVLLGCRAEKADDDDDGDSGIIDTGTVEGAPDIELSTTEVVFDAPVAGEQAVETLEVRNVGDAALSLAAAEWSGPADGFVVLTPVSDLVLAPGEQTALEVGYTLSTTSASEATLTVFSDDPDEPEVDVSFWAGGCRTAPEEAFFAVADRDNVLRVVYWDGAALSSMDTIDGGPGGGWTELHVADFDQDGSLDVLGYRLGTDTLDMAVRDDGEWRVQTQHVSMPFRPHGVADLNGDGAMDIYGVSQDDRQGWTGINEGDGTFTLAQTFDVSAVDWGYSLRLSRRASDINGDGHLDLISASYASQGRATSVVALVPGLGDGTFGEPQELTRVETGVNGLDLVDLDGDGRSEIIAGLDDDGNAGLLYSITVSPTLSVQTTELLDQSGGSESVDNAPGQGRAGGVDWCKNGREDIVTTINQSPGDSGVARFNALFHQLDDAGAVQTTEDVSIGGMFYRGAIGLPVW